MFKLKSAVELLNEPGDLKIPSYYARKNVEVGQTVRLILEEGGKREYLWFKVTAKSGSRYAGKLHGRNWNYYRQPSNKIRSIKANMVVAFMPRHIYNIQR